LQGDCPSCGSALPLLADVATLTGDSSAPTGEAAIPTMAVVGAPGSVLGVHQGQRRSDPSRLAAGKSFGTRYHIIGLLGAGGMGAVYKAWDVELNVVVALKVIRLEFVPDQKTVAAREKQFKNELLLARQVTHKNVVRIHDLGEIDGIKYITMPYLEGEDLSTILKQKGPLDLARALQVAREIAAGLQAAHEANVVHRDLKPANIMIGRDGRALILDFGIALSSERAHSDEGSTAGTLEYMAPEQARGGEVDQRSDIYALGLILYDMLLGRRKPSGEHSAFPDMMARIENGLPRLTSVNAAIPLAVDELVAQCLEADPVNRFQTSKELAGVLARLDDQGEPIPEPRRLTGRLIAATVVLVAVLLGATYVVTRRAVQPQKQHDPVSVVIADFQNLTGDPAFDRTLEPMLKRALEGAGFISAYDREGIRATLSIRPPEKLDEQAARELAVKQGLGVVLSGSIEKQGSAYGIAVKAVQTVTGDVVATAKARAATKDDVLGVTTRLVTNVRKALGDEASESAQMFAMASLSATSLDVVRYYAAAQEAASRGRFDDARQNLLKAVELDPKFGVGYELLSVASRNLGNLQDAEKYINQALRYLDGMTERERLSTRGMFYRVTGDYPKCVKEYGDLIARFSADVSAHNQRALCLTQLRDMRGAVDEMRSVVVLVPSATLFRVNLALYIGYASDFPGGEKEARAILAREPLATLPLAFAQVGQGNLPEAAESYRKLAMVGRVGKSFAASGLGDVAAVEGRFSEAVKILEAGAAEDLMAHSADRAAAKFVAAAYAQLSRGQKSAAVAAAGKALANSDAVKIRFLAARTFIEAGDAARAQPLIAGLGAELQAEPQALAKILESDAALNADDVRQAIKTLTEANAMVDTWIGHFDLGRAYLKAGAFPQADSEFDHCIKRRGEALALFLDEEPTYAYLPPVYYYQGRVREALSSTGFADAYRAYLAIRGQSKEDPLLPEVRRRVGK